jgi:NADPH:quinone reductase-like Zn-dependent oxidoreductase
MPDLVPTAVEALLTLLALWLLRRFPRTSIVCAAAAALLLRPPPRAHPLANKTMRAAIFTAGGAGSAHMDAAVADDVRVPGHAANEMLIKVRAAGLNPSNFKVNMARLPFYRHLKQGHHVVGYDVEGVVVAVGDGESCTPFSEGDSVYGFASGSIAEYSQLRCGLAARSPTTLTPVQTAGLPVVAITSQQAWDRAGLAAGQRALVIGASGGCGNFGVSLGKAIGAHITGICSTRNVALVRELGADRVVDYTSADEMAGLANEGAQFDVIYDTVSSFAPEDTNYYTDMRKLLTPGSGRYVAINGDGLQWTLGIWEQLLFKPWFGVSIQPDQYDLFLVMPTTSHLDRLTELLDTGKVPPTVTDKVFKLDEASLDQAFARMKSRRTVGKICFEF